MRLEIKLRPVTRPPKKHIPRPAPRPVPSS